MPYRLKKEYQNEKSGNMEVFDLAVKNRDNGSFLDRIGRGTLLSVCVCHGKLSLLAAAVIADMDSDCSCELRLKSGNLFLVDETDDEQNNC